MKDKRKYIRTELEGPVSLTHPGIGAIITRTRDVSDAGVYLLADIVPGLSVGDEVQIQAQDLDDAPVLKARVVRIEKAGVALIFCLEE